MDSDWLDEVRARKRGKSLLKALNMIDTAIDILEEYTGGFSGTYNSVEEFRESLMKRVRKIERGDITPLTSIYIDFLPSEAWDNFVGNEGAKLADKICATIKLTGYVKL